MKRKTLLSRMLLLVAVAMGASSAQADTYVKVTQASDLVAGETYIIASSDGVATAYASKLPSTNQGYTTSGDALTMTTTTPLEFTLGTVDTNTYSLKMSDGKFLGYNSSTNFRNTQTAATAKNEQWTIAYNETYSLYTIVNVQTNTRHIGYSGNDKFAPYASMSSNAPATLYKKQAAYDVTATSNNETMGTVSLTGSQITATPKEGYRVSKSDPYTVTSGTATVVQSGNVFTVTPSSACNVQINFEAIPQHTVKFFVNGEVVSTADYGEDADITFPSEPADLGTYTFRGWVGEAIDGKQTTKPELVSSATMGTADANYYAVFATGTTTTATKNYTLDYENESGLSSSTKWGNYGTAFTYTASDGSEWVVKAYKNSGMQINTGKNASIKVPTCPGYITSIAVSGSAAKAVGFSASDYSGSGTITYIVSGTDATSQTLDLSGKNVTTGYIVPKSGNIVIKKIVVSYEATVEDYTNYCTSVTETVKIGSLGYATFSAGAAVSFAGSGVTAYTVKYADGVAKLTAVEQVPAGAGVIVEGAENSYEVSVLAEADALEGNDLLVSDGTVTGGDAIYCLADGNNGVGFYRVASTVTIPEGKAYLNVPTGARQFIGFDGEATGISAALNDKGQMTNDKVFNLNGQRVAAPQKGLCIVNGKKVVIK